MNRFVSVYFLSLAGCAQVLVTAKQVAPQESLLEVNRSAATHGELSQHSVARLYHHGVAVEHPDGRSILSDELERKLDSSGDWRDQFVIAELLLLEGGHLPGSDGAKCDVDALVHAGRAMGAAGSRALDPRFNILRGIYSVAMARLFVFYQEEHGPPSNWESLEGRSTVYPLRVLSDWPDGYFDRFVAADTISYEGIGPRYQEFGLGTPLVAVRVNNEERKEQQPYFSRAGIALPATAVLDFDPDRSDELRLLIKDTLRFRSVELSGGAAPLSADFTAAVACLAADEDMSVYSDGGFFRPGTAEIPQGICMLQPYDPNKIPVVFTHGLWSNPLTWRFQINALVGDEEIRERYQIWLYLYPTGESIVENAMGLRRELDAVRGFFDPELDDFATQDIVLVGHSMGGILSATAVRTAGTKLWDVVFAEPLENSSDRIAGDPSLREALLFEPRGYVTRLICLSAPHGGSSTADGFIGTLGNWLITPAEGLLDVFSRFRSRYADMLRPEVVRKTNSVEDLSPESPILRALREMPISPSVRYHTIIGQIEEGPLESSSDGVVPYHSASMPGAVSELVVRSDHSTTQHPEAVAEVRRILRLHAQERDAGAVGELK